MIFRNIPTLGLILAAMTPSSPREMTGYASWYGKEQRGKLMANGRAFDDRKMTCASWFYPLGTQLVVENPKTGGVVRVCVTDRGPAWRLVLRRNRIIDLSHAAFAAIAYPSDGVVKVKVTFFEKAEANCLTPASI